MSEENLLRIHSQVWNLYAPQILISPNESVLYLAPSSTASQWAITKYSNQGWAVTDSQSEVLIFGVEAGWDLSTQRLPVPTYCFGSYLYRGHSPDLIRLTEAMQQSLTLLRSYPLRTY